MVNPDSKDIQDDGRRRFWGFVVETGKWMRVITEPDGETIHNAFYDRGYKGTK